MSRDLSNLLAFLVGVFIAAALLLPGAVWATTVIPDVPGYTSSSAGYTPSVGQLKGWSGTYNTTAKAYPTAGKINIMSKVIPVTGKATLTAGAAALVKNAIKLNPTKIALTLAAGWLIQEGLQWQASTQEWIKTSPGLATYKGGSCATTWRTEAAFLACYTTANPGYTWTLKKDSNPVTDVVLRNGVDWQGIQETRGTSTQAPSVQTDWDNASDPTPTVAPELPNAEYMPEGAPVNAPTYDFAPQNVPIGSPYKKPDGSTWQDGATVSPAVHPVTNNYNSVKIVNYSTKITNIDGSPVPVPVPEEKPDVEQDQCQKYPKSVGCAELGEFNQDIPKSAFVFEFEPEAVNMAGSCPADIQVLGSALSFQPACGAMSTIKPLVVGMAAVAAALILFGGMRGAD